MNNRRTSPRSSRGNSASTGRIDGMGQFRLILRLIDGRIGCSRYNEIWLCCVYRIEDSIRPCQIKIRPSEGRQCHVRIKSGALDQTADNLPVPARYNNFHAVPFFRETEPSRSPA